MLVGPLGRLIQHSVQPTGGNKDCIDKPIDVIAIPTTRHPDETRRAA